MVEVALILFNIASTTSSILMLRKLSLLEGEVKALHNVLDRVLPARSSSSAPPASSPAPQEA